MRIKKQILMLALALLILGLTTGCPEVAGDHEGYLESGSILVITDFEGGGYVDVSLAGVIDPTGAAMDFTLLNGPLYADQDESKMASIFLQSYRISFETLNGDIALQDRTVFLPNTWLGPNDDFQGKGWPIVPPTTVEEYFTAKGGVFTPTGEYNVVITFKAETEYGDKVEARTNATIYMGDF